MSERVKIARQTRKRPTPQDTDTRTPSGKPLPY